MKRGAALMLGALAAFVARSPALAAAQKITISVPGVEGVGGAFYVAQDKGYFAAEGLDVELLVAGGGIATPALISGSIDGSASSASALTAILRGAPLRIALVFEERSQYQLWAAANIRTFTDLKGKSVGIQTRGDSFEIAMRLALQGAGLSPDAVGYTALATGANIAAALESGAVPAGLLSPDQIVAMRHQGQLEKVHMLADFFDIVRMPVAGFAMSEKVLYGDPVLARKMVRAIVKGARYEKAFKSQTVAIIGKYQKDADPQASAVEYDEFMRVSTRDFTVNGDLIASDLGVRAGLIGLAKDQIPPVSKIYDFSLVRAVNAELDASRWKPAA
jgi:NitT/TauT family transport system substrate-binding protein